MPWFIKAINSLRSKIGADGQNPIVFELWVIMADRKLVAHSHSERFPPRQPETPKHDSRCKEDLVLPSIGASFSETGNRSRFMRDLAVSVIAH